MSQKKAKKLRQQMRKDGIQGMKRFTLSSDNLKKMIMRQDWFAKWTLTANMCDSALRTGIKDEKTKARIENIKQLSLDIQRMTDLEMTWILDTEREKWGVGDKHGYLLIGYDNGLVTCVKSAPPPEVADPGGLVAELKEAAKHCSHQGCGEIPKFIKQGKAYCEIHLSESEEVKTDVK